MNTVGKPFDFVAWLNETTYWVDINSRIILMGTEKGGVFLCDAEYRYIGEGATLEEACRNFDATVKSVMGDS